MTEAQGAEQFRLLQQEIVLAGEAVETLKRDQRAAIAALRLDVEVLKRCLCQVHPELAAQFETIRATLIRIRSGGLVKRGRTTGAGRRVSRTSLTARRQSLILSACVGRSYPQPGARQGLGRSQPVLRPGSRLHKNLLHLLRRNPRTTRIASGGYRWSSCG